MDRYELRAWMTRALYDYATLDEGCTWHGKRRGLRKPCPEGVWWASCGAYRSWAIHAHDGTVAYSIDGYRAREKKDAGYGGKVLVLAGEGHFIFPWDNSAAQHSLDLRASEGAHLINVTMSDDVPWEPRIEAMAQKLIDAHAALCKAIQGFDEQERQSRLEERRRETQMAVEALKG